jgi:hypothetical protein
MSELSEPLNRQHIVACLWDFDKTLCPHYMQTPLFKHFGIDEDSFWDEVNGLPAYYAARGTRLLPEIAYLNHMLSYVKAGIMKDMSNKLLFELGKQVPLCPGLPDAFQSLKDFIATTYAPHNIRLEHYILSTGLKQMILGCAIAPFADGIYGSEFLEESAPPHYLTQTHLPLPVSHVVTQIACPLDNTSKTRIISEINKGVNKDPSINVNSFMGIVDRRVPFQNMIYIADGPSDVPAFSVMRQKGGLAFAVYNPNSDAEFNQTDSLLQYQRVNAVGPANYLPTSSTFRWLKLHLSKICDRIVNEDIQSRTARIGESPKHLSGTINNKSDTPTELL